MSRRAALGSLGLGALAGAAGGVGAFAVQSTVQADPAPADVFPGRSPSTPSRKTVASWTAIRGDHYYIAHRGSGDVFPEHTMEAYQAAFQWGAPSMEISVGKTSDDVLVCMHDGTYDRTTTAVGKMSELPSTVLRGVGVRQPRLGPAWMREPLPSLPLFEDVLRTFGGHVVLCLEPKDNLAYPLMVEMVEKYGLKDSVIFKLFYDSPRIAEAKEAGYPVFVYIGRQVDLIPSVIDPIVDRLDPATDYLVIPAFGADAITYTDDEVIRQCVRTNCPVWVYPLHRRVDAEHFFDLGVAGAICSSFGYISSREPSAKTDSWRYKAIASGEMTKDPSLDELALSWTGEDELSLARQGGQHFVTLGQLCPLRNALMTYQIDFQARWTALPRDRNSNFSLAFGHADDSYYEHRYGKTEGYHALLRPDGRLELYRHSAGNPSGQQLGATQTKAPVAGTWMAFRLEVGPRQIKWSRLDADGGAVVVNDGATRGGYLHLGRSASEGVLSVRQFMIT